MIALLDAVSPSSAPSSEAWTESAPPTAAFLAEGDAEPLAALVGDTLSPRFCAWRGASGRRYIVSVYEPDACPAYCDAVLIAVAVSPDGRRQALTLTDTGVFPEPVLARLARSFAQSRGGSCGRVEFHLHLLAASPAERREALDDLRAAAPYAARS